MSNPTDPFTGPACLVYLDMTYVLFLLMLLMTSNDIHSWQEVTNILYPDWKVDDVKENFIWPPDEKNDVAIRENSSEVREIDFLSLPMPIPMPSEVNLHEWQPRTWIGDAISQDRPDVLEFMLRHDLMLSPAFSAKDSMLAQELCASGRAQYVALYLLYEPIDFDDKLNMILSAHRSKKISIATVNLWFLRYIINRKTSGKRIYPKYMKTNHFGPDIFFY